MAEAPPQNWSSGGYSCQLGQVEACPDTPSNESLATLNAEFVREDDVQRVLLLLGCTLAGVEAWCTLAGVEAFTLYVKPT
jgi:hypothetical protein